MSRKPIDTHNGSAVFENDRELQSVSYRGTAVSHNFKFNLKHIFRGGAIIWCKQNGQDYYVVFRSKTRPNRGVQLPGGRIERNENPAEAILREVQEESGIESKVICPLGMIYFENQEDNYSSLQIYYLVRPVANLDITKRWKYIDKDHTKQELECWFEPVSKDPEFLSAGQAEVVYMFRQWLKEHKKPTKTFKNNFKSNKKPWFKKKNSAID